MGWTQACVRSGPKTTRMELALSFRWVAWARGLGSRPLPSTMLLTQELAELVGKRCCEWGWQPLAETRGPPICRNTVLENGARDRETGVRGFAVCRLPQDCPRCCPGCWAEEVARAQGQSGHRAGPVTSGERGVWNTYNFKIQVACGIRRILDTLG